MLVYVLRRGIKGEDMKLVEKEEAGGEEKRFIVGSKREGCGGGVLNWC